MYDHEESSYQITESPFFRRLSTTRTNLLSKHVAFVFFENMDVDLLSTTELLYPNMQVELQIIKARRGCHMISNNPIVSVRIAASSPYTRCFVLKGD